MALTIDCIGSAEGLRALAPAWATLFERSGAAVPFACYEWVDSWWAHLGERRAAVRDRLQVHALWDGEELVGVAPLVLTERPGVGPVRARHLHFVGADPNMTELRGVLALPQRAREVYLALYRALRARDDWDWLHWSGLRAPEADPVLRHLQVRTAEIPMFLLRLAPSWDAFRSGLKPNIKESLRKCYNSLKRDGHVAGLRVARSRSEVLAAVERFLALHRARAGADAQVRHNDVFSSEMSQQFLREVCGRFADRGVARVFELTIGEQVVAVRLGFQFSGALYLYYSGYDPAWSRYSVMTTCVAEAIKYAIGEKLQWVNLSTGRDVSKTRWGPEERSCVEGLQLAPRVGAQLSYRLVQEAYRLREREGMRNVARLLARQPQGGPGPRPARQAE